VVDPQRACMRMLEASSSRNAAQSFAVSASGLGAAGSSSARSWKTDRAARRPRRREQSLADAPTLGAVGRRADGKVAEEAEGEPALARGTRSGTELAVRKPLQIESEANAARMSLRELPRFAAVRLAQTVRPRLPWHARVQGSDRVVQREALERLAAGDDEALEFAAERISCMRASNVSKHACSTSRFKRQTGA
jgi:hypothetical protein